MAYKKSGGGLDGSYAGFSTQIDAGLGLVYRLNHLWSTADRYALDGELDKWNFTLDRLFCNLCYRNPIEITLDENNQLVEIKLCDKDNLIFKKFADDIKKIKASKSQAIRQKSTAQYNNYHQDHYDILMLKDIWLRKFMNELGLYLKEAERNPAMAMFGGG